MLVWISAVNHSTKRIKDPIMTMPGSSCPWLMRMRMRIKNSTASAETVTANEKSLTSVSPFAPSTTSERQRTMVCQLASAVVR